MIGENNEEVEGALLPLSFDGGRYSQDGYPFETTNELANYQKLLVEVAKQTWLEAHPDRQRLPREFEQSLELRLIEVRKGSVLPYAAPGVSSSSHRIDEIIEKIRDIFAEVVQNGVFPNWLSEKARAAALRFGATVRTDEKVYLNSRTQDRVEYTQAARALVAANEASKSTPQDGVLVGKAVEINPGKQSFQIELSDGSKVDARFGKAELWPTILQLVGPSEQASVVRFHANYLQTAAGQVLSVADVTDLEVFLESASVWTPRLVELLKLRTGWLDGVGSAVALSSIKYANEVLGGLEKKGITGVRIYPTPEGGVQLEAEHGARYVELVIGEDLEAEGYFSDSGASSDGDFVPQNPTSAVDSMVGALHG